MIKPLHTLTSIKVHCHFNKFRKQKEHVQYKSTRFIHDGCYLYFVLVLNYQDGIP